MTVLLAFLSACSWGASDFLGGLHSKRHHFLVVTACRELVGIALFVVLIAVTGGRPRASDIAIGLGVGVLAGVALPVFFRSLASGRMALVAPVAGSVGAVVPVVIGIVGGERPTLLQYVGLAFAVGAIAFVSIEHIHDDVLGRRRHIDIGEIVKATLCGVVFGLFYAGMHHTSDDSGLWPGLAVCFGVLTTIIVWISVDDRSRLREINLSVVRVCGVGGVLDTTAATLFLFATREGFLSITAAVASLYPVGTAVLAAVFLKEKLNHWNVAGLTMCVASLALVVR